MEIEPMKSHMPKGKHSINILKERLYIECKHLGWYYVSPLYACAFMFENMGIWNEIVIGN